jgi:hypothetical protein
MMRRPFGQLAGAGSFLKEEEILSILVDSTVHNAVTAKPESPSSESGRLLTSLRFRRALHIPTRLRQAKSPWNKVDITHTMI